MYLKSKKNDPYWDYKMDHQQITYKLILKHAAKGNGGDKYIISDLKDKDRYIYVSQKFSRLETSPINVLYFTISPLFGNVKFTLKKEAKGSGDDRYNSSDPLLWPGDIYLIKELRNEVQYVSVNPSDIDNIGANIIKVS